jgi:serine/threonine protein phosphatase PrpC
MALTRQLGSQQDYAVKGNIGNVHYIGVMDGHGVGYHKNLCIELLRSFNFDEIALAPNPVDHIQSNLQPYDLIGSGSTFTFARIYKNNREIEVINVGDSKTVVIINGNIIYTTPEHTFHNLDELERVRSRLQHVRPTTAPFPVNEREVHMLRSDVGIFLNGECMVPTQCFGHNNISGLAPSIVKLPYTDGDTVRVICGSDGFWDMYMEHYIDLPYASPEDLIQLAEDRWKQQWEFHDGKNKPVMTSFGDDFDDIGISVWDSTE